MNSFRVPALVLMLLAGGPMAAAAQTAQDFRWSGVIPAGQRVEVKGINGAIRAEPSSGREVEVTAVRRAGRRGDVEDVRIETVPHDGGVTICAIYPTPRGQRENRCTPGENWQASNDNNDVSVDFVVRVPRGVHFLGRTVNGAVEAERMPANAFVSTVNGAVRVSAVGVVEASTVNGDIDAATGTANPGRDLEFRTVNGNITLRVPADFRAQVRAKLLNGNVSSDFPITVTRGRFVGAGASGEIGSGGRRLDLETVNGSIRIRRAGGE
ncbi:MAG TPA: DUF4097 family beta strand repeat-containing protein [Longimicrobiaceae bacterium]|nr:DUF4097 family beta strand repeat-containing protein [Longimicrobiaceae bacterium]